MRRSAPPSSRRLSAPPRPTTRGALAAFTASLMPSERESPRASRPAPLDPIAFAASLVDLRSGVALSQVLEATAGPLADHPHSATALAARDRALAAIDAIESTVSAIDFGALPRARALTTSSLLGTLRGLDLLETPTAGGIERAVRTLFGPFSSFIVQQSTRAHADIDDAVALAAAALAASSPRARQLISFHEVLERIVGPRRATLLDRPLLALGRSFAEALEVAVIALSERPDRSADADLAPWLAEGGLFPRHLDLAGRLLRTMVEHHARTARALLHACSNTVIHNSSTRTGERTTPESL